MGHDRFIPNPFQFIIHQPTCYPLLYSQDAEKAPLNPMEKEFWWSLNPSPFQITADTYVWILLQNELAISK
jgi:hypothetical protein